MNLKIQCRSVLACGLIVMVALLFSGNIVLDSLAMDESSGGMGLHHSPPPVPSGPLPPFAARVVNLSLDGGIAAGEKVTFVLEVATSGAGIRPVPWVVYARDRVNGTTLSLAAKTTPDVSAGSTFTEKISWTALPGTFEFFAYLDPQQSLGETAEEQIDNRSLTASRQFSDWQGWSEAFLPQVQASVRLWIAEAAIGNYRTVPDRLTYTPANSTLLPDYVAAGVKNAVSEAWIKWARSVEVPVITTGGSVGLSSLRQSVHYLQPTQLAVSIKSQVGPASDWYGGDAAIEKVSRSIFRMFDEWRLRAIVSPDGKGRYKLEGVLGINDGL